jgi:hypothetical protein
MGSHGAVASYALGEEVWEAVSADWRTAPLRPELKATLAFLEKLTLRPDDLKPADADEARAAGVSDRALLEAATVCALFNMIVRLADSLGWEVPTPERLAARAPAMLEGGYALTAVGGRDRADASTDRTSPWGRLRVWTSGRRSLVDLDDLHLAADEA